MSKEIEKKYKVKMLPQQINKFTPLHLTQTYLDKNLAQEYLKRNHLTFEFKEARIRSINGDQFFITFKQPTDTSSEVREENEFEISEDIYNSILELQTIACKLYNTKLEQLKKKRYEISGDNDLIYELDIYEDELEGLITVEVEFSGSTEEEALKKCNDFDHQKPNWFGQDITNRKDYKNACLAKYGLPRDAKGGFNH